MRGGTTSPSMALGHQPTNDRSVVSQYSAGEVEEHDRAHVKHGSRPTPGTVRLASDPRRHSFIQRFGLSIRAGQRPPMSGAQ